GVRVCSKPEPRHGTAVRSTTHCHSMTTTHNSQRTTPGQLKPHRTPSTLCTQPTTSTHTPLRAPVSTYVTRTSTFSPSTGALKLRSATLGSLWLPERKSLRIS